MIINDSRLRYLVGRLGGQLFLIIQEIAFTSTLKVCYELQLKFGFTLYKAPILFYREWEIK